jgi:gas vesicle protein
MKKETKKVANKKVETESKSGLVVGAAAAIAAFAGYYLFGPKGKDNRTKVRGWTLKAKGEVLEKLEKLEDISEDKYHSIVDSVMDKYKKVKTTTDDETDALEKELKQRFKHVVKDLKKSKKKVVKKVNKVRTDAASVIKPEKAKKSVTKKK